ncbi:Cysteine-rich membrane protein 2 [Spironucleus salmonicida]|uniref:Cysteine-rich membrane protein 2 n=1 Tax=Spironucleus salmonicida TaxID=348837 RepID=V6LLQ8_9EUKA|nr:Cysteine-rich membrane protein 2 [Spironucleus salmonicida]|eukprot:EST45522.1 Cysteine-rich membrane protein 2 [Spironucleus salmonicida]
MNSCPQQCYNGTYCNLVTKTCEPCKINQIEKCQCKNNAVCSTCDSSNYDCASCPPGMYLSSGYCSKCHILGCSICNADTSSCEKCINGYQFLNKKCILCDAKNNIQCTCGAAQNCATCGGDIKDVCNICLKGYLKLNEQDSTCNGCEIGYKKTLKGDQVICEKCNADGCVDCGIQKEQCIKCDNGLFLLNNTCGECVANMENKCQCELAQNCATCRGLLKKACDTCQKGYIKQNVNATSCNECEIGYKKTIKGDQVICEKCNADGCIDCGIAKEQCIKCDNGLYLLDNTCKKCTNGMAIQCQCGDAQNCSTCENNKGLKCSTCVTGYQIGVQGTCSDCAVGFTMVNKLCLKCHESCGSCSHSINTCDSCTSGYEMSIYQTCQPNCIIALTIGQVCLQGSPSLCGGSNQITECKCNRAKNCLTCSSDVNSCDTCLQGYQLKQNQCQECVKGATQIGSHCFFTAEESSNQALSGAAITGIVITVLIILGLISGGVFWFIKKSKSEQYAIKDEVIVNQI